MNLVRVTLGLSVGLAVTEFAFRHRDGGAFAHLNVYVSDPELGVRLRPGSSEKIRFSSTANPITEIRINADGYRGGPWPAPVADEVIVMGDSQVFGLGVEEKETFSSVLQTALGEKAVVRNLGVPTYGPHEYNAAMRESLAKRPAKTVVWVVNMANDLFEATRPNKTRHVVWDGWAVRTETAPKSVTSFPGRSLLYTDSHAFLALRRWNYDRGEKLDEGGFASEGTWKDIGGAAVTAKKQHLTADQENERLAKIHESDVKWANDEAERAAGSVDAFIAREMSAELEDPRYDIENDKYVPKGQLFEAARLSPGDIVTTQSGENSRDIRVNAEHIRRGAELRSALEKKVREKASSSKDEKTLAFFAKRDALEKEAAALRASPPPRSLPITPLSPALREAKEICDKHGARLLVVVLPIDVQVSKEEWKKYGVDPPIDMDSTRVLNADIVATAQAMHAAGFDAISALTAAQPGAFLDGDIHMTVKGHKALGEAIATVLKTPKLAIPDERLPRLRSWPPQPAEWTSNTEIAVTESDPAGCETKKVREWLGIFCRQKGGARGVKVDKGIEVMAGALPGEALLIAPMIPNQDVHAVFAFEGGSRDFTATAKENGETTTIAFSKQLPARTDIPGPTAPSCGAKAVVPDPDCARTYANDCAKRVACDAGDHTAPPTCAPGQAHAGAAHRCRALCSKDVPCASGTCTTWQGGQVCM